jgi:hypothetical protein
MIRALPTDKTQAEQSINSQHFYRLPPVRYAIDLDL